MPHLINLWSSLLADPKARKVIVIEHPLLPLYIKELIARILFDNHVWFGHYTWREELIPY